MAMLKITWKENDTPGGVGGTWLNIDKNGDHPARANGDVYGPDELEDARALILKVVCKMEFENKRSQQPDV